MGVMNFESFNEGVNKGFSLTDKEKEFLWAKMEVSKKKRATESKNDLYMVLKDGKDVEDEAQFIKILNSLEYKMKKRVKDDTQKAPKGKYEEGFDSLRTKLPSSWAGVKYSVISRHKKKD